MNMYKSKLQQLCHQQSWSLPEYSTDREGPDHNPRFKATVTVNGIPFKTPDHCRSSKDAQNKAAKIAFDHFTSAPKPVHTSSPSSSGYSTSFPQFNIRPSNMVTLQPTIQETKQTPVVNENPFGFRDSTKSTEYSTSITDFDFGPSTAVTLQPTIQEMKQTLVVNENPFGVRDHKKSTGYSISIADFDIEPSIAVTLQPTIEEMKRTPLVIETPFEVRDDKKTTVVQHLNKNRLQTYSQKRNIPLPVYSFEREGPPHASRFRCKVIVDGKTYESLEFFPTLREAENAAAKVAFESLSLYKVQEDESGLYKSLLQEFAQKKGFNLPKYNTTVSGPPHTATFVSTVEIGGKNFQGEEAKNKKQAEMNAAKVAYTDLQEQNTMVDITVSGPHHTATFVSTVEIGGQMFQGEEAKNKKQAEMSAAKVAYTDLKEPRASQSPTILSSGDTLKEALKISSSILQSVISVDDFPQIARSEPSLVIHKEQDEEDKDGNQERYSSKMTTGNVETRPLHPPIPSPDEGKNAKRNKCSSSSDNVYAYLRDPFRAISASPEEGTSSPSMPLESTVNSVMDESSDSATGNSNFPCRKVSVYPRKLNVAIPDGASVLKYSDDWMAVLMESNQNH